MAARWLTIEEKHRRSLGLHASAADFTATGAEAADSTVVLRDDRLSLYCLDPERREALFVELPPSVRLTEAAFVYLRQYEEALRLLTLPYDEFERLAAGLAAPKRFVMIYMTGRSGSTLLSHSFNRIEGVASLSEPDAPIGFVDFQRAGLLSPNEARRLFDASVRMLFRASGSVPHACVLKMRSESLQMADLIQTTYPDARNLFVYRDAVGFVGSMYRVFRRLHIPETMTRAESWEDLHDAYGLDADALHRYLPGRTGEIAIVEHLTVWWLGIIEAYLAALGRGIPFTPLSFEDLAQRPDAALARVFDACGLEGATPDQARPAFRSDSQAGTVLERERPGEASLRLTAEQIVTVRKIVSLHPLQSALPDHLPSAALVR